VNRRIVLAALGASVMTASVLFAVRAARAERPTEPVARVGSREVQAGEVVARARLDVRANGRSPGSLGRKDLEQALGEIVDEEAHYQEALRRGLDREDEVVRRLLGLQVYLADVAEASARLEPTPRALAETEKKHESELARFEGASREHEVRLRWMLDERDRLSRESVARARERSGVERLASR